VSAAPANRTPVAGSANRIPVAVLGATGAVGQTFVRLLHGHPLFELVEVAASERSVGRRYDEATHWHQGELPETAAALVVSGCDVNEVRARVVFSALDASVAGSVEEAFARAGAVVLSNARNHRMGPDVPLVIPEVNADHLDLIETQRLARAWPGAIVTNANCAVTTVALALAPLHRAFGLRKAIVTTMQAVSGAGYPGVPSLDILSNVIPHIPGEESKIEQELTKLLGTRTGDGIAPAPVAVSAHANRVPVLHGHTACLSVAFEDDVTPDAALDALLGWQGDPICRGLPSAPDHPIVVRAEEDRPQARRDVNTGRGMSVVVGRVRHDPVLDLRLVAMTHNTVRGAAGGSILNAEVMGRRGMLPGVPGGSW
jgi:aspartate-semialdehyde dehydrogenase